MKLVDEYHAPVLARALAQRICRAAKRRWVVLDACGAETCGGASPTIAGASLDQLLDGAVELVHGPGCPVCVTPLELIDRAHAIAARRDVVFTSFAEMMAVRGSRTDLRRLKAKGADVRTVCSPLEALRIAREEADREVVFFGIGFETTAPANAMAIHQARRLGLDNFSLLVSQLLIPPALAFMLAAPESRIQAVLGPGPACAISGFHGYRAIAHEHRRPIVISGPEPIELLTGILGAVQQLESGRAEVENAYPRGATAEGNDAARALFDRVYQLVDTSWRGLGLVAKSGYAIRPEYRDLDAAHRFEQRRTSRLAHSEAS